MASTTKNSFSCKLTDEQRDKLVSILTTGNYRPVEVPYTIIAVEGDKCRINVYTSGKLLVQGSGTGHFVLFVLEPEILGTASWGYEELLHPEDTSPHMGSDESGKGDFFGPLVTCAVYTDPTLSKGMASIGAKDCKCLSDKQVLAIGAKLRAYLGPNRYKLVTIGPESYNRLYLKNRNVNSILSWAHARCIENLLETMPSCPRAVADQFGAEHLIKGALMKKGREIVLEQHHKAEADIAVAAASVIAREYFLHALQKLSEDFGTRLPKGASNLVVEAAKQLVREKGPSVLPLVAKCHFRTTDNVLAATGHQRSEIGPLGLAMSRGPTAKPYSYR